MSSESKKEKKKDKKEKNKKLKVPEPEKYAEDQQETEKQSILSMLDRLDNISKAKSRIKEEKLRRGIIEIQSSEEDKEIKKNEIAISEIKKQIEELRESKQEFYEMGENVKSIEIAKKIIDIANMERIKLIVNEEKKFIEQVQAKISPKKPIDEQIKELKIKRHTYYTQEKYDEAIQIAEIINDLAKEAKLIQIVKTEENFINLMRTKIDEKMSKKGSTEPLNVVNFIAHPEKEEVKLKEDRIIQLEKIETSDVNQFTVETEEKRKFEVERLNFEKEKDKFQQEKLKFEEVKELFQKKKFFFKERKKKFKQKKLDFKEEKVKFKLEKVKFQEEKEAFKWEKQMLEEVKKFEAEKDSS